MELDESKESQPAVAETAESPEPAPEEPIEAVQTTETVQETKPPSASGKTTGKKSSKQAAASTPPPAPKWEPPFWVKAMEEATQKKDQAKAQAGMTFAPDNLLPLSQPRRRPGPSLNGFRNMARQAKTPRPKA